MMERSGHLARPEVGPPMPTSMDQTRVDTLVAAALAGDLESFNQLVIHVYPQLVGFLAFHAPNPELVDEITQATFVAAFENLAKYQSRGVFAAWVKGIGRNLLRTELSRRSRLRGINHSALESLLAESALGDLDRGPDLVDVEQLSQLDRLRGCLQKLSPRMRMIAERRFVEEVPVKVMAQQFKQSCASLAKVIFTIRRELRSCAEGRGDLT